MSEFEFRESPSSENGRTEREGLPPGYRMRADAHYVDALSGAPRADRARDAARTVSSDEPLPADAAGARDRRLFDQLTEDVAAIESAAAMLAADGSPLGRRVGLDLIKAQSARAAWLLRATALQHGETGVAGRRRPLGIVLGEIRDRMAVECRLVGVRLEVQVSEDASAIPVLDAPILVGMTGAIMAQLGVVTGTDHAVIRVQATVRHGESLSIEVTQDTAPAAGHDRFFDAAWTSRPGGWLAAMGAASAKLTAERLGGSVAVAPSDRRGSAIRWTALLDRV